MFPNVHSLNNFLYNIPRAKLVADGTQSIATAAFTTVTNMTVAFSGGRIATAADGITVKVSGIYDVDAWQSWASNSTGRRAMRINVNGADLTPIEIATIPAAAGGSSGPSISTLLKLNANDKVSVTALQSSGGNLVLGNAVLAVSLKALTK